jgi:hypothetical protein
MRAHADTVRALPTTVEGELSPENAWWNVGIHADSSWTARSSMSTRLRGGRSEVRLKGRWQVEEVNDSKVYETTDSFGMKPERVGLQSTTRKRNARNAVETLTCRHNRNIWTNCRTPAPIVMDAQIPRIPRTLLYLEGFQRGRRFGNNPRTTTGDDLDRVQQRSRGSRHDDCSPKSCLWYAEVSMTWAVCVYEYKDKR